MQGFCCRWCFCLGAFFFSPRWFDQILCSPTPFFCRNNRFSDLIRVTWNFTLQLQPLIPIHRLSRQCKANFLHFWLRSVTNAASRQSCRGGDGGGSVHFSTCSLPLSATHPSPAASISLPSHYYCLSIFYSLFPTSRLWLSLVPVNPSHHLSIHPPPSENHQLSFSPSTPRGPRFDHGTVILECLSSLFHCSISKAASSSTIYLLIKINILTLFPPTVCDLHVCRCTFVAVLSLHQALSSCLSLHFHDWAPFLLLHSQDRVC